MRLAAEPTASTSAKVPANPSPGSSPSSSRSGSVHPSTAAATSQAAARTVGERMKQLLEFAAYFALGYLIVNKVAPVIQAKVEAMDLDSVWDVWDHEGWM